MPDLIADYSVTGTNNPNKQVSVTRWNAFVAAIVAAIAAAVATLARAATDRDALAATIGTAFPVYLMEGGREGWFKFVSGDLSALVAIDTQQGIYIAPQGQTGSTGAWVRQFSGPINVLWFGAVADDATDASPAFAGAFAVADALSFAWTYNRGAPAVYAPFGKYYCATGTTPKRGVKLTGDGGKAAATVIRTPAGVHGINLDYALETRSPGMKLRGLRFKGGYTAGNEGEFHGIRARVPFNAEDVWVENYQGDGFNIVASSDLGANGNLENANCFAMPDCGADSCRRGLYIQGNDGNAGYSHAFNGLYNRAGGIVDESALGNTHTAPHIDGTGIAHGHAPYAVVERDGRWFTPQVGQNASASATQPPATATDTAVWLYVGNGGVNSFVPTWTNGINVRSAPSIYLGGGGCFLSGATYVEGGQPPVQVVAPSMMIGNIHGGTRVVGTGTYFRNENGASKLDKLLLTSDLTTQGPVYIGGSNSASGDFAVQFNGQNFVQWDFATYNGGFFSEGYLYIGRNQGMLWNSPQAHIWRVAGNEVGRINASGFNVEAGKDYRVDGTKVVGAQGAAIADVAMAAAAPTKAEFDALATAFNSLLARVRASTGHGLIA